MGVKLVLLLVIVFFMTLFFDGFLDFFALEVTTGDLRIPCVGVFSGRNAASETLFKLSLISGHREKRKEKKRRESKILV